MAMNEDFNFAELCRLCSLKSNHHLQIFDKEGEQRQLLFKIRSCIPAVITKEDALPKNICQRCVYKLDMFYEFRVSCMTTDTVLKNYADSLKNLAASVTNQKSSSIVGHAVRTYVKPMELQLECCKGEERRGEERKEEGGEYMSDLIQRSRISIIPPSHRRVRLLGGWMGGWLVGWLVGWLDGFYGLGWSVGRHWEE
ncbi:hypothetical protein HZH68_009511 [Vespula germanica]|uniref:ZAD domain-containing protein n=1 Tax=Vespula germanica TaxID=30212 RepID=A0A834K1F4_VESGE|nr:hypothetical protein HZH68_009511 [Vespula germanica]